MRASEMPGFFHFKYYRYLEHVGVNEDFEAGYRSRKEMLPWLERDPVKLQRERLIKIGLEEKEVTTMERRINEQIERSIAKAKQAPFPAKSEFKTDVYA